MRQCFSIIILVMFAVIISGCSPRGATGDNGSGGISNDDKFVPNLIDTVETEEELRRETVITNDDAGSMYHSLTEASDDSNGQDKIFTLSGLVVQGGQNTNYTLGDDAFGWTRDSETTASLIRVTLPAVSLTFDGNDGHIAAVTAYFADKTYHIAPNNNGSATHFSADITSGATSDATNAMLTVDRGNDFFGFSSNYMVHIGWNLDRVEGDPNPLTDSGDNLDRSYDINGSMLAGIETQNAHIPTRDTLSFNGKGKGYYTHIGNEENYTTIFDIVARINFTAESLTINSSNTMQCAVQNVVSSCNNSVNFLNFTTPEALTYTGNNISGGVVLASDLSVSGIVDARFYGVAAREFGGAFAIRGTEDGYYYGAFGGEREGIINPTVFGGIGNDVIASPQSEAIANDGDGLLYTSLAAAVADTSYMGDARVFTLKGVASYRNENISYARAPNRTWDKADIDKRIDMATITGSAVSLTLNDDGKIAAVMLHLNNETYISDQFIAVSGEIVSTVINDGAPDNANFARVVVDRSARFFNFSTASNYMTYVSWRLTRNADRGQTSTLLNDSNYRFDGNMIAGMETIGSDITTSGESIFRGRGRGTYGSEFESYATIFDVVANVDFASYVINLNIENNCEASYCIATPLSHLDFSTRLNYNASTNDSSGSANTGQLSGEVNARFYGPGVDEFGGTFILSGNNVNDYYYGAFGSKRGVIAERPAFVTNIYSDILGYNRELDITSQIQKNRHTSLTEASSVTAGENILAMNALAVYKNDTTTYSEHSTGQTWTTSRTSQELYTANILNPAAAVEFNENGDISGVTAYLAYETYEANNFNPSSAKELSVAINSGAGDASVAILNINRSDDFFGFNPNYMAYISWNLIKTVDDLDDRSNATRAIIYDIDGSMLAGLETDESNIPTIKTVSFDGKGRGLYGNLTENHTTIFDVKATVDFTAFMIDISVEDTMQCSDSNDISSCNTAMGALDFNVSALNFTNSDNVVNNIKGNVSAGSLSGTLDARFYGDVAWEFGGTFALTDSNSYYFGAFGSERDGIATPFMFDSVISAESVSADEAQVIDNAIILNNNAANDNIVTMRGLSVYQNDVTDYIRAPNRAWAKADIERNLNLARLSGSAASFGLAEDDSGISLITAYLNGNIYTANIANPTSSMSASATITEGAASDANTAILNIETGIDFFGFLSNAMIYVSWNLAREISDFDDSDSLTDRTYNIKGSMIAGIETLDTSISATGTANFDGKGRGTYKNISDDTGYETIFDVVTVVDFTNSNVTISSSGTCKASDCAMKVSALDFTSNALSYTDNNISGAVNTDGIGAGSLSGTLDARFYGYDEAVALGGTFALSDSVSYYYGAFGTQKDYTIFTKVATTRSDTPTTFNSNNLTSFSKNSMDDISGNIFKIKTAVEVTKNNTDKTIYTNKITDAVVDFDYTSDYVFNDYSFFLAELKLYFADKKYERTDLYDGYKNTAYIDGDGAVDNPSNFDMSLRNKFGFTSNYMALVEWQVAGDNGGTSGYGITGFETAGNKIPTIRSVGFTGKGQGQYYDLTNIANVIYFDMTANVDFSKRTVDLVTTKSCITEKYSHCSTADTRDDLNFTGALSYDAGVNTITGTVETAGDASNLKLTGNAEAYFFSTGVAELGGTFHMQN
ncbi:MAG: transferrin-binding protein-like solute binding protein, partial [Alphaproteobacteria bacterium]|nr:transferrin-binding protein-like solute binding protein [Alphaproteobacteria bacterium]